MTGPRRPPVGLDDARLLAALLTQPMGLDRLFDADTRQAARRGVSRGDIVLDVDDGTIRLDRARHISALDAIERVARSAEPDPRAVATAGEPVRSRAGAGGSPR